MVQYDNVTVSNEVSGEIFQICSKVIHGRCEVEDAINLLHRLVVTVDNRVPSLLLDVLTVLDYDTDVMGKADRKERFRSFCISCSKAELFDDDIFKVMIDSFTDDSLSTRFIKTKTRLFYKQLKFNLLREESEGYAKLIVELSQPFGVEFTEAMALDKIHSLIGQFNLDPNRVLDIILECFECRLEQADRYVSLLRLYSANPDDVCHILGFKFTFYRRQTMLRETSNKLYRMAARLLQEGLVDLLSLCQYLVPKLEWILQHNKRIVAAAERAEKKINAQSLGTQDNPDVKDALTAEDIEDELMERNQKLCLLLALLEVGDWPHAKHIMDRLPEFYATRYPEICAALANLVHIRIAKLYAQTVKHLSFMPGCASFGQDSKLASLRALTPVRSYAELVHDVFPMVCYCGPNLAVDPVVLGKLVRLCTEIVKQKSAKSNAEGDGLYNHVVDLCDEVLLPSLSLLRCNCALSEEMWTLVSSFPYQIRFRLYGHWKAVHMKRHPQLILSKAEVQARTKYIMKRLSKETTKQSGRLLSKLCHTHPTVVFDYILNQIQQFENLIGPVVDSLRFLTNFSYDVLAYCVIEELASPGREKMKVSDITISAWLQSMATFVGSAFKKYNIELTGVLQYVANQLKAGKSYDLLVLREIVQNMSGIETTASLTQEQMEALAGGDLLRQEGGYLAQVRNTKRSTNRLKEALLQEDLVVSLCILTAQQRGSIVYTEGKRLHLKLVGQMLDQCLETLVQFGSFLSTNLKAEDYIRRMPAIHVLVRDYHLEIDAAFFLARPMYTTMITGKYDELKKLERSAKSLSIEKKLEYYLSACDYVLNPVVEELQSVLPDKLWESLSPRFLCTFWTLCMYDLNVPNQSYEREIDKLKKAVQLLDEQKELSDSKRRKEKERCSQSEGRLGDEQRRQQEHVNRVFARLQREKLHWFPIAARGSAVSQFLQLCLFPRATFTDLDALFCAKFVYVLHALKTPNFSTLICFDRIFCDVMPSISSLSDNESSHFGRFLCAILDVIMKWHSDKELFEKECATFPGFQTRFRNASVDEGPKDQVDYLSFRHVAYKWHFKLTKILPQFPVLSKFTGAIEKHVTTIRDEEKDNRPDLHVLAISYWGQLKVRKINLVDDVEFRGGSSPDKPLGVKKGGGQRTTRTAAAQALKTTAVAANGTSKGGSGTQIERKEQTVPQQRKDVLTSQSSVELTKSTVPATSTNAVRTPTATGAETPSVAKPLTRVRPVAAASQKTTEDTTTSGQGTKLALTQVAQATTAATTVRQTSTEVNSKPSPEAPVPGSEGRHVIIKRERQKDSGKQAAREGPAVLDAATKSVESRKESTDAPAKQPLPPSAKRKIDVPAVTKQRSSPDNPQDRAADNPASLTLTIPPSVPMPPSKKRVVPERGDREVNGQQNSRLGALNMRSRGNGTLESHGRKPDEVPQDVKRRKVDDKSPRQHGEARDRVASSTTANSHADRHPIGAGASRSSSSERHEHGRSTERRSTEPSPRHASKEYVKRRKEDLPLSASGFSAREMERLERTIVQRGTPPEQSKEPERKKDKSGDAGKAVADGSPMSLKDMRDKDRDKEKRRSAINSHQGRRS